MNSLPESPHNSWKGVSPGPLTGCAKETALVFVAAWASASTGHPASKAMERTTKRKAPMSQEFAKRKTRVFVSNLYDFLAFLRFGMEV